ncbi:MAG: FAD-dependent oxidoreductase [Clostridia bacterium]|nr:FAD-dependent oxidoreductase [Clostridia bacterium]
MNYDVLIIGGGPAGITAAIYAKRAGRNVAVVEKYVPGGQLNMIGEIENYTGFSKIEGANLAYNMYQHAKNVGVTFIMDEAVELDLAGGKKIVKGKKGEYSALAIVLAQGCHTRELGIEGEQQFKGRGVSYCATCDGNFFKNKPVAVVGSGDSAVSEAIYLSSLCSHVYLLTKPVLKLHNYAESEIEQNKNITLLKGALSSRILGDEKVEKLVYIQNEEEKAVDVEGVFVAIGKRPDASLYHGKVETTTLGYVVADEKMQTSAEGVFVCGDLREGNIKQIATAVGDGAVAGNEASKYVLRKIYAK